VTEDEFLQQLKDAHTRGLVQGLESAAEACKAAIDEHNLRGSHKQHMLEMQRIFLSSAQKMKHSEN
jgi:hypothetical protein